MHLLVILEMQPDTAEIDLVADGKMWVAPLQLAEQAANAFAQLIVRNFELIENGLVLKVCAWFNVVFNAIIKPLSGPGKQLFAVYRSKAASHTNFAVLDDAAARFAYVFAANSIDFVLNYAE